MTSNPTSSYRSASLLALCATVLSIASIVTDALAALSMAAQIQLLELALIVVNIPPSVAEAQDARQRLLAIVQLTIGLATAISFLMWLYRVTRNARALGAEGMAYSPGWSVGWFFVPLANLIVPYWILKEIWKTSTPAAGENWREAAVSPIVGMWWAVCLVRAVIRYSPWPIVTGHWRLTEIPTVGRLWLDGLWEFSWGLLIADVIDIAASVLTVVVVLSITGFQERRRVLLADSVGGQLAAVG